MMTTRPSQPEPFVRGAAYPATGDVPYPRANPADQARLAADVWHSASVPAGVRLELVGDAQAIDIAYRTTTGNLGYRGDGAGILFSVWRSGRRICQEEAVLGDGLLRLALGDGPAEKPAVIYLPEGMQPVVLSLTAVKGEIAPAPERPRWLAYGDAVTQGWIASGPAQGWAAIAGRKGGLDLVNMGYAGSGQTELLSAEHLAGLEADVISVALGAGAWNRIPYSPAMLCESVRTFLALVRLGHPDTPIVVVSPIYRRDAEYTPNKLGATLADLRDAIEVAVRDRIVSGDATLSLVSGTTIIGPEHLADGIHPGDEGHKRLASTIGKALASALKSSRELPRTSVLVDGVQGLGLTLAPLPALSRDDNGAAVRVDYGGAGRDHNGAAGRDDNGAAGRDDPVDGPVDDGGAVGAADAGTGDGADPVDATSGEEAADGAAVEVEAPGAGEETAREPAGRAGPATTEDLAGVLDPDVAAAWSLY